MPQLEQIGTFSSQIFWLFVSFAIIYYFISRVASPKIGGVLRNRQNVISSNIEKASNYKDETLSLNEKFELRISQAKLESLRIINEASSKADEMYKSKLSQEVDELKDELSEAEAEILSKKEKVQDNLSKDVTDYVEQILQKIANVKVDKKEIAKAIAKHS